MPGVTARFPALTLAQVWSVLAWGLPALAALLAVMPAVDLAYQLRAGSVILDTGAIPRADTWTFTAGYLWTDQQWGAQILLTVAYRLAGWTGLALLRAGLVAVTCWLLARLVAIRAPRLGAMARTLLVLAAFTAMATALALRPQLFAIPLFVLALVVLADRAAHPRRIWAIPLLTLVWANLHGSFPLVLVLLGLGLLGDVLDRRDPRPLGVVTLASVAATLVNPFGLGVWEYVLRITTSPTISKRVSEWQSPSPTDPAGAVFWLSIVAVAGFLVIRRLRTGPTGLPGPVGLLTLAGFGLLGAVTGRGIAWWPPAALFVMAPLVAKALTPTANGEPPPFWTERPVRQARRSAVNTVLLLAMLVVGLALLPIWRPVGPAGVPLGTLSYAPQGIARYLNDHLAPDYCPDSPSGCPLDSRATIKTWAPQVWGSWLEFVSPQQAVALDSRIELYPDAVWQDADLVNRVDPAWDTTLGGWGTAFVITQKGVDDRLDAALRASSSWTLVYEDSDGSIFERRVIPL